MFIKMTQELSDQFERFSSGDVVKVSWLGRNGEMVQNHIYCGIKEGYPLLVNYDSFQKSGDPSEIPFLDLSEANNVEVNKKEIPSLSSNQVYKITKREVKT